MSDGEEQDKSERQSEEQEKSEGQGQNSTKEQSNPSAMEWVVGGIAALLVLGGIGFLVYEALRGTASPPLISIEAQRVLPQETGGYIVEIVAQNQGGTTARALVIEGKLLDREQGSAAGQQASGGGQSGGPQQRDSSGGQQVSGQQQQGSREVESATTTLSWVPAHAEREGGLFFSHDPREYRLELAPQGYDRP